MLAPSQPCREKPTIVKSSSTKYRPKQVHLARSIQPGTDPIPSLLSSADTRWNDSMKPKKRKNLRAIAVSASIVYVDQYHAVLETIGHLLRANCSLAVVNRTAVLLTLKTAAICATDWIRRRVFSRPAPLLTKRLNFAIIAYLWSSGPGARGWRGNVS